MTWDSQAKLRLVLILFPWFFGLASNACGEHYWHSQKLRKAYEKQRFSGTFASECAVSSVVEHYLDTVGVTGSNPVSRTISFLHAARND